MKIDNNGKIGGKISIIDIAILLVAVIAIAGIAVKFSGSSGTASAKQTIVYEMTIRNVRQELGLLLRDGDSLFIQGGGEIGVITGDPVITPAKAYATDLHGDYGTEMRTIEGKYDVTFNVRVEASNSGGRIIVDRTFDVTIGRSDVYLTKYTSFYGYLTRLVSVT